MNTAEAKKQYNSLLKGGELKEVIPGTTGKWESDQKLFLRYCEENEKILNDDFMDIEVLDEDIFDEYNDI